MFDDNSRYQRAPTYVVTDRRGREVTVVGPAPPLEQALAGYHLRKDGQRLDILAERYLGDATAFWRIVELSGVVLPEALSLEQELPIPRRNG
jgi:hypothetical protein